MNQEILVDLFITEGILDVENTASFELTSLETGLTHGIIRFSSSVDFEPQSRKVFENLKSKLSAVIDQSRKRGVQSNGSRSLTFHPTKHRKAEHSAGSESTMIDSGNHISGFQKIGSNEKMFTCDLCGANSKSKAYLTRHVSLIHKSTTQALQCEMCNFATKWSESLKKHYVNVHKIPKVFEMNI